MTRTSWAAPRARRLVGALLALLALGYGMAQSAPPATGPEAVSYTLDELTGDAVRDLTNGGTFSRSVSWAGRFAERSNLVIAGGSLVLEALNWFYKEVKREAGSSLDDFYAPPQLVYAYRIQVVHDYKDFYDSYANIYKGDDFCSNVPSVYHAESYADAESRIRNGVTAALCPGVVVGEWQAAPADSGYTYAVSAPSPADTQTLPQYLANHPDAASSAANILRQYATAHPNLFSDPNSLPPGVTLEPPPSPDEWQSTGPYAPGSTDPVPGQPGSGDSTGGTSTPGSTGAGTRSDPSNPHYTPASDPNSPQYDPRTNPSSPNYDPRTDPYSPQYDPRTNTSSPNYDPSQDPTKTPTPGTSTPGTSTPGTSTPGTSTPGTSTPGDSTPGTSTPGDSTPGTSTPGTSTPGTSTPGDSTPGDSTPSDDHVQVPPDEQLGPLPQLNVDAIKSNWTQQLGQIKDQASDKFPFGIGQKWFATVGDPGSDCPSFSVALYGGLSMNVHPCDAPAAVWAHTILRPVLAVLLTIAFGFGLARIVAGS